ncbi:SH3-domain GRB2-like endophilin B1, partial [Silurus asotus]
NMEFSVRRLAADAGTFLSRAVQFTEEKLGQAEKTELDAHLENLLLKSESTKHWTERILKQTEVLLQPNPTHLQQPHPFTSNNPTAYPSNNLPPSTPPTNPTPYTSNILVQKERKLLQVKRLDLDAAKTRLKKARVADARSVAEMELRIAQSEFDRQAEITRLLLEGISSTHAHHLRCLNDFVDAQAVYYAQCYQYMVSLQKQLGSFPSTFSSNNNQPAVSSAGISAPATLTTTLTPTPTVTPGQSSPSLNELRNSCGPRQARVLYDYDAACSSELSLLADEVITVSSKPGMDSDWLMGERGHQKGKVPITYLELLN